MTTVIVATLAVLALLWFGQRGLIYFPDGEVSSPLAAGLPSAEVVTFETEDRLTLAGWFVPPTAPAGGYTLVIFNGNAGNRADRAPLAAQLAARGVAVMLFDYRGYGGNPGLPTETGLALDSRAALAAVGSRPDVDESRLVFLGESLGAAVALRLALEFPPAAVILRSPFSSLVEIGQIHYPFLPVRWLARDRFMSIDRIGRLTSPLLVIAGDADRIVPYEDTLALFEEAPEPKQLVTIAGADHNDASLSHGATVLTAITALLDGAPAPPSRFTIH